MLCKLLRSFYSLDRRNPSFTSQMKATEQYFPIVLFIMLYYAVQGVFNFRWMKSESVTIQMGAIPLSEAL